MDKKVYFISFSVVILMIICLAVIPSGVTAATAIGYMLYVRGTKDVKLSNALTPLFGKKFKDSWFGKLIDIVVVFGIIASITTSLGLAVPVMSRLISSILPIEDGTMLQLGDRGIFDCHRAVAGRRIEPDSKICDRARVPADFHRIFARRLGG